MSLVLRNADPKAGPITPRLTHAIIFSEIELLLTPDANSLRGSFRSSAESRQELNLEV